MAWPTESVVWGVPRALEEEAGMPVPARFVALEEAVLTFEIRRRWSRKMIE
jgi:hypothetical protein